MHVRAGYVNFDDTNLVFFINSFTAVNIVFHCVAGDICDNFDDGDTVTITALKKKHLISAKAGRIKVLASGRMTKSLTVIADKFSIQAVKMITLAGGTAKKYV